MGAWTSPPRMLRTLSDAQMRWYCMWEVLHPPSSRHAVRLTCLSQPNPCALCAVCYACSRTSTIRWVLWQHLPGSMHAPELVGQRACRRSMVPSYQWCQTVLSIARIRTALKSALLPPAMDVHVEQRRVRTATPASHVTWWRWWVLLAAGDTTDDLGAACRLGMAASAHPARRAIAEAALPAAVHSTHSMTAALTCSTWRRLSLTSLSSPSRML